MKTMMSKKKNIKEMINMEKMNKTEKLKRALKYALSLVAFQEVGAGPDENLSIVKGIVSDLQYLCILETGIELVSYPTRFIKENKKEVMKLMPFTLVTMAKEKI